MFLASGPCGSAAVAGAGPAAPRVDDTRHLHAAGLRVERVTFVPAWASYLSLAGWRSLLDLLDGVASGPIVADQCFSPDLYGGATACCACSPRRRPPRARP